MYLLLKYNISCSSRNILWVSTEKYLRISIGTENLNKIMNAIDIINKIKKDNKIDYNNFLKKENQRDGINKFQGKLKTKLF